MNPMLKDDYCIIFSVNGKRVIKSDYRASTYDLKVGEVYNLSFLRPYPLRVEDIFVSDKTKTIFVALTEINTSVKMNITLSDEILYNVKNYAKNNDLSVENEEDIINVLELMTSFAWNYS